MGRNALHWKRWQRRFTRPLNFPAPNTGRNWPFIFLPLIIGQGDGTNDDLVRTKNGWRILPDNLEALAGTLKQALSDAKRLRAMGAESYRIVAEEINLEKMVGVFVEALNSVK
jgi:glycosyltransferase involved in cell wall biosynthesis